MGWDRGWAPYVPVAVRRRDAERKAQKLIKQGRQLSPIRIAGRKIATTFWGQGWCNHLEKYSDYASRLPRGRTYARNGSIIDLQISAGMINALVSGSSLYRLSIAIEPLKKSHWKSLCELCSQSVHSLIDLMRGTLSADVLASLSDPKSGMFPSTKEIKLKCSCPDNAYLCKHLAAVLYGVGHRLDSAPELLFALRGVQQSDLLATSLTEEAANRTMGLSQPSEIESGDLESIFGIDLVSLASTDSSIPSKPRPRKKSAGKTIAKAKPPRTAPSTVSAQAGAESRIPTPPKVSKQAASKKPASKKPASKKPVGKKPVGKKPVGK